MGCYLLFVRIGFDDLVEVVEHIIVGSGSVANDKVPREQLRHFLDCRFVNVSVETSEQVTIIDREHLFTCDFLTFNLGRQFDAEVKHNLEKQVFAGAVSLDVIHKAIELRRLKLIGSIEHVLHIRRVEF